MSTLVRVKHLWATRGVVAENAWPRSVRIYGRFPGQTATLHIEETTHDIYLRMQVRPVRHLASSGRCETDMRIGNAQLVSDKWEIVGVSVLHNSAIT